MPLILGTNSIKDTGFDVANSTRFNSGDSAFMSKASTTVTNDKKFTVSAWCKRSKLGSSSEFGIFKTISDSNNQNKNIQFGFYNDSIYFAFVDGGSVTVNKVSTAVFRDSSAWYHVMLAVDSTQGTAANRNRIYVNGTEITSFGTDTNAGADETFLSTSCNIDVGRYTGTSGTHRYFDGYLAEVVFIDGLQLAPTDFGEFDADSPTIWKPKDVSGLTFGTNGFYLDFEDSSNLGNDANGGTDFTVNNLTSIDQTTDTCTNNFCTLMSNHPSASNFTLSEGNLVASKSGAATVGLYGSSIMLTKGKWYYESKITDLGSGDRSRMGVAAYESVTGTSTIQGSFSGFEFTGDTSGRFSITVNGSTTEIDGFHSYAQDDIIMWGIDMDNSKLYIGKNGDWFNYSSANTGGDPTSGNGWVTNNATALASPLTVGYVGHSAGVSDSTEVNINFGNPPYAISSGNADGNGYGNFEYAVPSGYYSICTKNLAEFG